MAKSFTQSDAYDIIRRIYGESIVVLGTCFNQDGSRSIFWIYTSETEADCKTYRHVEA